MSYIEEIRRKCDRLFEIDNAVVKLKSQMEDTTAENLEIVKLLLKQCEKEARKIETLNDEDVEDIKFYVLNNINEALEMVYEFLSDSE